MLGHGERASQSLRAAQVRLGSRAEPELAGKIVVQWKVGLDGAVTEAFVKTTTMKNQKVEECMERQIKRFKFDPPDGGICIIEFPFVFSPSD